MKKKSNSHTNKAALRNLSDGELQPLIDYCAKTRGAKAEVTRQLNKVLPEPVPKIQVSNWLNSDATKRAVPSFPAGKLLLEVWEGMKGKTI